MDESAQAPEATEARSNLPLRPARSWLRLSPHDVLIYRACDAISGLLLCGMVVFSPWAFGTTEPWAIRVMNVAGYALGFFLAAKLWIRWAKGYRPPRWDAGTGFGRAESGHGGFRLAKVLTVCLAIVSGLILLFCLVSAWNARSTYHPWQARFEYHAYVSWLPHSYDSTRSWSAFWSYLGLACGFWAARDWLLGMTEVEGRTAGRQSSGGERLRSWPLPTRLRRLLWVLCVNGALLGVEGIVQRLEGSGELLFLVKPRVNPAAVTQFGPYAYRANASQYFNMVWPVCLGFWWILHRTRGTSLRRHHALLLCAIIMAACPTISTSRGGALISAGLGLGAVVFLAIGGLLSIRREKPQAWAAGLAVGAVVLFVAAALGLGYALGWKALRPRLEQLGEGFEGREQMYELAEPMAKDFPLFGTGPGTFDPVFQLYRPSLSTYWPAQLHNDWLETRITFGIVGSAFFGVGLACVLLRWFARGGIYAGRRFGLLVALALAGCLVHARFDFPFQIHSLVFLFLLLCAVFFCLTRRP